MILDIRKPPFKNLMSQRFLAHVMISREDTVHELNRDGLIDAVNSFVDTGLDIEIPINHGPLPKFGLIASLFERMSHISGPGSTHERKHVIEEFICKWREDVGNDMWPAFRLILPHLDPDCRLQMNAAKLGKVLADALDLPKNSEDWMVLAKWNASAALGPVSAYARRGKSGEAFSDAACDRISRRLSRTSPTTLDVGKVSDMLCQMVGSKQTSQVEMMKQFLACMNGAELKWLIRIMLENPGAGLSERTLLPIWHKNALALFNVTTSLKIICHQLWDDGIELEAKDSVVRLGVCFKPMLSYFRPGSCKNFDLVVTSINDAIAKTEASARRRAQRTGSTADSLRRFFYIEEKVDGERIQLHWSESGQSCRWFSRNGQEWTESYGSSINEGALAPYLKHAINPKVRSCILDGEMVAYDSVADEVLPLTKIRQVSKERREEGRCHVLFLVFDVLCANGHDFTRLPLCTRKQALSTHIFPPSQRDAGRNRIEVLSFCEGTTAEDIGLQFRKILQLQSEGLVVKNPWSAYRLNGKSAGTWIKVKPEYMAGYEAENFDLVVVGANRGEGKYAGKYTSFILALRDSESVNFYTFCRVGSGFGAVMFDEIHHLVGDNWSSKKPHNVRTAKGMVGREDNLSDRDVGQVWLAPEVGLVLEVKASQIIPSDVFAAGWSLRFPRFVRLRRDKGSESCMSLANLTEYREALQDPRASGKSKRGHLVNDERAEAPKKQKRKDMLQARRISSADNKMKILDGVTVFVGGDIKDPKYFTREEVESFARSMGAEITRRSQTPNSIIIADRDLARVHTILKLRSRAIVHSRWLFDCFRTKQRLPFEPDHYLICPKDDEMAEALTRVDRWGIPLRNTITPDDISRHFDKIVPPRCYSDSERLCALRKLSSSASQDPISRSWLFTGCRVFCMEVDVLPILQFGGAIFVDSQSATHIVCDNKNYRPLLTSFKPPHIVSSTWVRACWNASTLLDEAT